MPTGKRIEYIDAAKGFAMLWLIWWHTIHPKFINPAFHVPLFFFVSGFFFKSEGNSRPFIQKKINTIFVPLLFFFFLGYFEKMLLHFWDTKQINTFNFGSIFDLLFLGHTRNVNVPLWFLLALLLIQIAMFIFCKVIKVVTKRQFIYFATLLITTFGLFCMAYVILPSVDRTYFEWKWAIGFIFIFSLGYVFGKHIMTYVSNKVYCIFVGICTLCVIIIYSMFKLENTFLNAVWQQIAFFAFSVFVVILAKNISGLKISRLLAFYGRNSLIVLGAQIPILIFVHRIVSEVYSKADIVYGFVSTLTTMGVLYFLILFLNRYMPVAVGKKPLFKF